MINELYDIAENFDQERKLREWVKKYIKRISFSMNTEKRYIRGNPNIEEYIDNSCKTKLAYKIPTIKTKREIHGIEIKHEVLILSDKPLPDS